MNKPLGRRPPYVRWLITVVLLVVVVIAGVFNASKLRASLRVLGQAEWQLVVLAALLLGLTFLLAAGVYQLLALKRLRYRQTVLVEVAASAVNRTLPAGLGALGLHGVYLYKHKHTVAEATAVVSVNNLLGITAHLLLLLGVGLLWPHTASKFALHSQGLHLNWIAAAAALALCLLLVVPVVRRHLQSFTTNLLKSLRAYLRSPQKVVAAVLLALAVTTTYTAILLVCTAALHLHITPLACFIVFSVGMLVGTATPTPGGLVGAEAGLFAGFIRYGFSSADALAAALLFRLITHWLPLVPGSIALLLARKRRIV